MRISLCLCLFISLVIVPAKNEYSLNGWEMNTEVCWAWLKVNWKSQRYCFGVILQIQHLFICLLKKWWKWNILTYFLWRDSNIQFRISVIHLKIEKTNKCACDCVSLFMKRKTNYENIYLMFYSWDKFYKLVAIIIQLYTFQFGSSRFFY